MPLVYLLSVPTELFKYMWLVYADKNNRDYTLEKYLARQQTK